MANRFVPVRNLLGELQRTEIRKGIGYKLTTKEFVLQREDQSYHIFLEDILGVMSQDGDRYSGYSGWSGNTQVTGHVASVTYKIVATKMKIYNRSGVFDYGASTLYTSLSDTFTELMIRMLKKT